MELMIVLIGMFFRYLYLRFHDCSLTGAFLKGQMKCSVTHLVQWPWTPMLLKASGSIMSVSSRLDLSVVMLKRFLQGIGSMVREDNKYGGVLDS